MTPRVLFTIFFVFLNEKKARITQYGFIAVLQSAGTKQGHSNGYISKNENRMLDFNTHEINFNRLLKFWNREKAKNHDSPPT